MEYAPLVSDAVLLSCHGSIADLADLPAFLLAIRRGRPVPEELLVEVRHRYQRIGGVSPLMSQSREQARLLEQRLGVPVRVAGRLWAPYPAELLAELASLGATRIVSLPLAPQSVDVYHQAVVEVATPLGLRPVLAPAWGQTPALLDAFRETIEQVFSGSGHPRAEVAVVLSAHSLPLRVIRGGDAYEREFRAMAEAVAAPLREVGHPVTIAFQSQGASNEPWLGPDLPTSFAELRRTGAKRVLIAPIGFLAEHIETLYDLDIEAAGLAERAGFETFLRAPAVAARPRLIDALEEVARRALA